MNTGRRKHSAAMFTDAIFLAGVSPILLMSNALSMYSNRSIFTFGRQRTEMHSSKA
jgi:hypothetical protein